MNIPDMKLTCSLQFGQISLNNDYLLIFEIQLIQFNFNLKESLLIKQFKAELEMASQKHNIFRLMSAESLVAVRK